MPRKSKWLPISRDKLLYWAGDAMLPWAIKALAECQRIEAQGHAATIELDGRGGFRVTDSSTGEEWDSYLADMLSSGR